MEIQLHPRPFDTTLCAHLLMLLHLSLNRRSLPPTIESLVLGLLLGVRVASASSTSPSPSKGPTAPSTTWIVGRLLLVLPFLAKGRRLPLGGSLGLGLRKLQLNILLLLRLLMLEGSTCLPLLGLTTLARLFPLGNSIPLFH